MKQFEYKIVSNSYLLVHELEELGEKGWQLVAIDSDRGSRKYVFIREKNVEIN